MKKLDCSFVKLKMILISDEPFGVYCVTFVVSEPVPQHPFLSFGIRLGGDKRHTVEKLSWLGFIWLPNFHFKSHALGLKYAFKHGLI